MRLKLSLVALGILMSVAVPVQAQQTGQPTGYNAGYQYQQPMTQTAPLYNGGVNVQPYYMNQQGTGGYNNSPAPFNFNGGYNNSMGNAGSIGAMTPEQAAYVRMQREAAAQLYQQQYMQQMQQPPGATSNQVGIYNQTNPYYPGQQQQQSVPTKRKVVYNQRNNPLTVPPRLFNPDQ